MSDFDKMQDEFNKEVIRRQNVIRGLSGQEDSLKVSIDNLNDSHKKLSDDLVTKQSAVDNLDATIKARNDEFEISKAKSIASLDKRETDLQTAQAFHDKNVKEHQDNVQKLNNRLQEFENFKIELSKEIGHICKDVGERFQELLNMIKGL